MKKTLLISLLGIWVLSFPVLGNAQSCCGRVTLPNGGIRQRPLLKGQYDTRISYQYSRLDRTLLGRDLIDDPLDRWNRTQSLNLAVTYGISDRFTAVAVIPARWTRLSILDDRVVRSASGLADFVGMIKYRLFDPVSPRKPEIAFGLGLKIPTGGYAYEDQYGTLSAGQQIGTGALDIIFSAQYNQGFGRFTVYGDITYRIPTENDREYRFGHEFQMSAKAMTPFLNDNITPDFGIETRFNARDSFGGDISDPYGGGAFRDSGGSWIYLTTGINFLLRNSISLRFESAFPVYEQVKGKQLSESVIWRAAVAYAVL